jgi:Cd2+/Zn2+-exporting ATPase/Cu+-exporting ATPase
MDKVIVEIPIQGMDCAECTRHVRSAIAELPGVESVEVYLAAEKAVVRLDPALVKSPAIRKAVENAGYQVSPGFLMRGAGATQEGEGLEMDSQEQTLVGEQERSGQEGRGLDSFTRSVLTVLGVVFGVVLFVVVVGEWLGLFEAVTSLVPWPVWLVFVLVMGWPIYKNVWRAALRRKVLAHTLMTVGVIAACLVGEWATAVVVAFFMRLGDYVEHFTAEKSRQAVRNLTSLAPQTARLERDGQEVEVAIHEVRVGEVVVIRPGEKIPVDGEVVAGQATVNQATITGESLPVEAEVGSHVFAATLVQLGSLRVRVEQVGEKTTFGRVIHLVEQAEAHKADVERTADRFSAWYLPVVLGVAVLTLILRRDPLAAAAVLVVACSCAFALATPIAMLASIGAGAKQGILIKGGRYLELLDRAKVLLIDKTGTLTLGQPEVVGFYWREDGGGYWENLRLAATAERYSEHPLAGAVRRAAEKEGLQLEIPESFEALPGMGVKAVVGGKRVEVGKTNGQEKMQEMEAWKQDGRTLLYLRVDGELRGVMAVADQLRPEAPQALRELQGMGIEKIELLTGDREQTARALLAAIGGGLGDAASGQAEFSYQAELLPEDKIEVVRRYQAQGKVVVMVGDGVNDAPALAQADVGIAMGVAGSDVAIEAAHVALMREDWLLIPEVLRIARRTMRVVRGNIAFTAVYNLVGLSLAALGYLPPIFAAALQAVPDLAILGNSSRLIRIKKSKL